MNKTVLGITGLTTIGLAIVPINSISADDGGLLDSSAQVTFTLDNSSKSPLDPTKPTNDDNTQNAVSPTDSVTGKSPNPGTKGSLLTIDFASSFNFGSHQISSVNKTYFADKQNYSQKVEGKVADTTTTGPNFVQVTDLRSRTVAGWSLKVKQNGDFTNASDNSTLPGAQITINNGTVLNGNGTENTISQSSIDNINIDTYDSNVMGAKSGEGYGTWLYSMGNKDTAGTSVSLTVPGGIAKTEGEYTTNLVWTLSDTAVQ